MQLIDEIINILSSEQPNLTNALIKSQVLAHTLGSEDLAAWVKNELNGYTENSALPPYRLSGMIYRGTVSNGVNRVTNWTLPLSGIPDEMRDSFLIHKCRDSIAVVENCAKAAREGKEWVIPVDPVAFPLFMDGLSAGYYIQSAKGLITPSSFETIIVQVRSKLLGFMLELQDKIPDAMPANIKQVSERVGVSELFNDVVFGDGAIVNVTVGSDNHIQQSVQHSIVKNDINSLFDELRKHQVPEADLATLNDAIILDAEIVGAEPKEFGQKVKEWMGKMIAKSGTAGWAISTQTAGALLASAIAKYYGL